MIFIKCFHDKFNNKTNGITHRRWLLKSNPELANLITEAIGPLWIRQPEKLSQLLELSGGFSFLMQLDAIKQRNKQKLAKRIQAQTGIVIDPSSIFDVQVKRLHAYKRQLLNVLHIMHIYNRMKEDPQFLFSPRTFIFGAKASPGYYYAKKIIKLINTVAEKVNNDPAVNDQIKGHFP